MDPLRKAFLLGMGALAVGEETVRKAALELMEKGEGKAAEGDRFVQDLLKKSERARKDLEKKIEKTVEDGLKKAGFATKKDIERLERQIRALKKERGKKAKK